MAESPEAGEEFVLQDGGSFKALAVAAKNMKKGEKARLIVQPDCAPLSLPRPYGTPVIICATEPAWHHLLNGGCLALLVHETWTFSRTCVLALQSASGPSQRSSFIRWHCLRCMMPPSLV